jgi:hypothetical protein
MISGRLHNLALLLLLVLSSSIRAQSEKDKIEALHVSFISKKLGLSSSESEKFWPLYNEYNDKVKALRMNVRLNLRKWSDNVTDAETEEIYLLMVRSRQAEADLYRQYMEKIRQLIGVRKSVKLQIAEDEFKREMISSIREKNE